MDKRTVSLDNPAAQRLETTGGKGSSLARLRAGGFPAPGGFVVTAETYRRFASPLRDRAREIGRISPEDQAALTAAAAEMRSALGKLAPPAGLLDELHARLRALPDGWRCGVRSSSTMEDLAGAAFAGQHESYLNCSGAEEIARRIQDCWVSLWSGRACAYRARGGFDHAAAVMAVVVQEMALCDVAGVGFTVDPVAGDLDRMSVDANSGLGESVVGGEAAVDHFTIDRKTLQVTDRRIAYKTSKVIASAEGVRSVAVAAEKAQRPCLSDVQLRRLGELMLRVEAAAGFPQDIEWGFVGDDLLLLQSRPVTSIAPKWTREESAERFPNVITPLTWDLVNEGFHRSLAHSLALMGLPSLDGAWFACFDHYIYGNENAVRLYAARQPFAVASLDELLEMIPELRKRFAWALELPTAWARDLDRYLIGIGELGAVDLGVLDAPGLWRHALAINALGADYFLPNIAISITQSALCRLLRALLGLAAGEARGAELYDLLMAHCDTKTGEVNAELHALAAMARRTPALAELIAGAPSRDILAAGSLEAFEDFALAFAKFLRDHGHREVDFDPFHAPWADAPHFVLDQIRLLIGAAEDPGVARNAKMRAQQAEHKLYALLPAEARFFYSEIIRLARVYTALDDLEHYQTTRLALPLRRALRALGEELVKMDALEDSMDGGFKREVQRSGSE